MSQPNPVFVNILIIAKSKQNWVSEEMEEKNIQ